MEAVIYIGVLGLVIWESVILPMYVENKITMEIKRRGCEVISLKLISRRECIYSVNYFKNGQAARENVRYGILGNIEWQ